MKILISGGHLTPALACIDYIQKKYEEDEIIFVGRKFSSESGQPAQEERELSKRGLKFITLATPKFQSHKKLDLVIKLPSLAIAIFKSIQIIKNYKIDVFLGFGGYLSIPLAIAAKITKTPIVIHEQTNSLGIANKLISSFAKKVALSQNIKDIEINDKFVITGNPIRADLLKITKKPDWIGREPKKPLLYITGGNQGSQTINKLVANSLKQLQQNFFIIHQLGNNKQSFNTGENYYAREWIEEKELAWILQHADLAISRSGANSVEELKYFAVPTLFIPLPNARNNEQFYNAKKIENIGGAIILNQSKVNNKETTTITKSPPPTGMPALER